MRAHVGAGLVVACLCLTVTAFAEPVVVELTALEALFKTLHAPNATESPRLLQSESGFVRFVGAPPGTYFFMTVPGLKSSNAEATARDFMAANAGAFAKPSLRSGFNTERATGEGDRFYVRLQQTYNGLPVFGAEVIVQTNGSGGVACVLSDIMQDPSLLENGEVALTPTLGTAEAKQKAIAWVAEIYNVGCDDLESSDAERGVYEPSVVGASGPICVVWKMTVSGGRGMPVSEVVLVDAHSGEVVFHYPLIHNAKVREIYDGNNEQFLLTFTGLDIPGDLVRIEGAPPTGIEDVDLAYDYLGDTYDFYYDVHGRDSTDNAGLTLSATVRFCVVGNPCPYENAFYVWKDTAPDSPLVDRMYFGEGMIADDVTAHELTHGVTWYESNLIYAYESGAINEGFSDIWGEYVDLTNNAGTDTPEVRWLMGEDTPMGALRDMADPPRFGLPDRLGSPFYYTGEFDNGGVHINMGVPSKLCYLLTDGDSFNGEIVEAMGIERTAELFYELQTSLLSSSAGWHDFYMALGQATVNQGYTFEERLNVLAAARAVEIAPPLSQNKLKNFRAVATFDLVTEEPVIALYWTRPESGLSDEIGLVRSTEGFPATPTDGEEIYRGRSDRFLDTGVVAGTRYFYSLFLLATEGFPEVLFAQAEAGETPPDQLTEVFSTDPAVPAIDRNPIDLAFTQILYAPTGLPVSPLGPVQRPLDYAYYTASIKKGQYELPVAREDEEGSAIAFPMTDDSVISFDTGVVPVPFFGKKYTKLHVSANGYVAFEDVSSGSSNNFPSLASHYAVPRISFLFADLSPKTIGETWARDMDDRLVLTFENVAEFGASDSPPGQSPNTVQVELFYSGHIRVTYLGLSVQNAVCGLSDGRGVPEDPANRFPNVRSIEFESDLSKLPAELAVITIEPMAPQSVDSGDLISLSVQTNVPEGQGVPAFSAEWDGPVDLPFGDNHDGTGTFHWQTTYDDFGAYTLRVTATLGDWGAYQDVVLIVGDVEQLPVASGLLLRSNNPVEDPSRDRPVSVNSQLTAEYAYSHPLESQEPASYAEGGTSIMWFKNNSLVPAFTNQLVVAPQATRANDRWFFMVTPRTVSGVQGIPQQSAIVTVLELPEVMNVALPHQLPDAHSPEDLPLQDLPMAKGPAVGGTTVVILGRFLDVPMSVKFGGVEVESIKSVSENRLEVVTSAHAPSRIEAGEPIPEDVLVTTAVGWGILQSAFVFVDTGIPIIRADVNKDGTVDAVDVQLVINALLQLTKARINTDVNRDGKTDSVDVQVVVNEALK